MRCECNVCDVCDVCDACDVCDVRCKCDVYNVCNVCDVCDVCDVQVFLDEPCVLYTKDIQKAWMHLQLGGKLSQIPHMNRRLQSE